MKTMTMMEHFSELRRRVLWCFAVACIALICGWFVAPYIQTFLTTPLLDVWGGAQLLYSGLSDGVMVRISLAMLGMWMVLVPFALWQIWAFVVPGLHKSERSFIWPIIIMSPILFVIGAAFAFYILLPFVFRFFVDLNMASPVPSLVLPSVRDYLGLAIGSMRVFGIAFQLPLVLVLLNRIGVLQRRWVVGMRRYAIVAIVIMAAVLTPPDVVSQILLALPMWALFEVSILFMRRDV